MRKYRINVGDRVKPKSGLKEFNLRKIEQYLSKFEKPYIVTSCDASYVRINGTKPGKGYASNQFDVEVVHFDEGLFEI